VEEPTPVERSCCANFERSWQLARRPPSLRITCRPSSTATFSRRGPKAPGSAPSDTSGSCTSSIGVRSCSVASGISGTRILRPSGSSPCYAPSRGIRSSERRRTSFSTLPPGIPWAPPCWPLPLLSGSPAASSGGGPGQARRSQRERLQPPPYSMMRSRPPRVYGNQSSRRAILEGAGKGGLPADSGGVRADDRSSRGRSRRWAPPNRLGTCARRAGRDSVRAGCRRCAAWLDRVPSGRRSR
jgi:hypothetical protein